MLLDSLADSLALSGVRSGHQQTQSFRRLYYFRTSVWSDILDADLIKDKFLEGHRDTSLGEKRVGTWKRGTRYLVKRKGRGTWETGTRFLMKRKGRGTWETETRLLVKREGRGNWETGTRLVVKKEGRGTFIFLNVCNTWLCIVVKKKQK